MASISTDYPQKVSRLRDCLRPPAAHVTHLFRSTISLPPPQPRDQSRYLIYLSSLWNIISPLHNGKFRPFLPPHHITTSTSAQVQLLKNPDVFLIGSIQKGQVQTPQQRKANQRYAKFEAAKRGKPESVIKAKKKDFKSPVSTIWIGSSDQLFSS